MDCAANREMMKKKLRHREVDYFALNLKLVRDKTWMRSRAG